MPLLHLLAWLEKNHDFRKIKESRYFHFFLNLYFRQGFTKFLKLVCLLNHINNIAAVLLLLLSKK